MLFTLNLTSSLLKKIEPLFALFLFKFSAILLRVFSGHHPTEIKESDTEFIDKIGLKEHLSPSRANGLGSMIKQLKMYAIAYQTKLS